MNGKTAMLLLSVRISSSLIVFFKISMPAEIQKVILFIIDRWAGLDVRGFSACVLHKGLSASSNGWISEWYKMEKADHKMCHSAVFWGFFSTKGLVRL